MHMSDALLSPGVAGITWAAAAGAVGYAAFRLSREEGEERTVPMMGVMGAFVFAAQMINFTIPGTGSSGHIGGGVLLAALLGPWAGLLTLTAVLAIQCLFFADGGLLALGCNVLNIGVFTCVFSGLFVYRTILRAGGSKRRIMAASVAASVVGLQLGSFGVVLETALSGVTALPLGAFAAVMQPIHLAIGLIEGLVTGAILCFVSSARPELVDRAGGRPERAPVKGVLVAFLLLALFIGGGLSLYASARPDGLEWSMETVAGVERVESPESYGGAEAVLGRTALFPDYELQGAGPSSTSLAGIAGSVLTVAAAGGAGLLIRMRRRRRRAGDS